MSGSAEYKLGQYAVGRQNAEGYTSKSSPGLRMIPTWLQLKTRAAQVLGELPTRELQTDLSLMNRGESNGAVYIACSSVHVQYKYEGEPASVIKTPTREYDYTQSILLEPDGCEENNASKAETMLKLLLWEDLFWTPYVYQHLDDELEDLELIKNDVLRAWEKNTKGYTGQAVLTGNNLAAFLARYWEKIYARSVGDGTMKPLIVIATSQQRNVATQGKAVIFDGVCFFHDYVLPNLPDALKEILSVSFGCVGVQENAQAGTACMFCYPEYETMELPVVYSPATDEVFDDDIDDVTIRIGQGMINGSMLDCYTRLCSLNNSNAAAQNFQLYYEEVRLDGLFQELAESNRKDRRNELEKQCTESFDAIQSALGDYGFSHAEITFILSALEEKMMAVFAEDGMIDDETVLRWANGLLTLESRADLLPEKEINRLRNDYLKHRVVQKAPNVILSCVKMLKEKNILRAENLLVSVFRQETAFSNDLEQLRMGGDHQNREEAIKKCRLRWNDLKDSLNQYGFSEAETRKVLYPLEIGLVQTCADSAPADDEMLANWANQYLTIDQNTVLLSNEEIHRLREAYEAHRIPQTANVLLLSWINLMKETGSDKVKTDKVVQFYHDEIQLKEQLDRLSKAIGREDNSTLEQQCYDSFISLRRALANENLTVDRITGLLYSYEKRWIEQCEKNTGMRERTVTRGLTEDALSLACRAKAIQEDDLVSLESCYHKALRSPRNCMETAVEIISFVKVYKGEIKEPAGKALGKDIESLLERTGVETGYKKYSSEEEAMDELKLLHNIHESIQEFPYRISSSRSEQLIAPIEIRIPNWYMKRNPLTFHEKLYEELLDSWLRIQNAQMQMTVVSDLSSAYMNAVIQLHQGTSEGHHPLCTVMKKNPMQVSPVEEAITHSIRREKSRVCSNREMIGRMIALQDADKRQTAQNYRMMLISQNLEKPEELLTDYLSVTMNETNRISAGWQRDDLQAILSTIPEKAEGFSEELLLLCTNWNSRHAPENDELTGSINSRFLERFRYLLRNDLPLESLIKIYNTEGKSLQDANPAMLEKELAEKLRSCSLDELSTESNLSGAMTFFPDKEGGLREIIGYVTDSRSKSLGVNPDDISGILSAARIYHFEKNDVESAIITVFQNSSDHQFSAGAENAILTYAEKNHLMAKDAVEEDRLFKAILAWAGSNPHTVQKNIKLLCRFIRNRMNQLSQRAEALQEAVQQVLPQDDSRVLPDMDLLDVMLPIAAENGMQSIRDGLMQWIEEKDADLRDLDPFMQKVCSSLGIRKTEDLKALPQWSKWQLYFLNLQTQRIIAKVSSLQISDLVELAEHPDSETRNLNYLYGMIKSCAEKKEDHERENCTESAFGRSGLDSIVSACQQVVDHEDEKHPGTALKMLVRINDAQFDDRNAFEKCVYEALINTLRNVAHSNERFVSVVHDESSVYQFAGIFDRKMNVPDSDVTALQKREALDIAIEVFKLYDAIKTDGYNAVMLMTFLSRIDRGRKEYELVKEVCYDVGVQSLMDRNDMKRNIPELIRSFKSASKGELWRFEWLSFLNCAYTRKNGRNWESARLLTDSDNTCGVIAALLNWMSEDGMEKIKESFIRFLDNSQFGKQAKDRFRKRLVKKYDSRTDNEMMNWMMKRN